MENKVETLKSVHDYFGLTYCSYIVLPRTVLQSMPEDWQDKFISLMEEMDGRTGWRQQLPGEYNVTMRTDDGKFSIDPFLDYERGRRKIPLG